MQTLGRSTISRPQIEGHHPGDSNQNARAVALGALGFGGLFGSKEASLTYRCIFRSSEVVRKVHAEDRLVHLESRSESPQA